MQFLNRRAIFAYVLILLLVALMTACGGGGSSADSKAAATVTQVNMIPAPSISMTPGQFVPLFAQALNANGGQVFTSTITFNSSNPALQIGTKNGQALLCAGTWDNITNPVVCNPVPGVTATTGVTSNITAAAGSVTSPTTIASVHVPIASVEVTAVTPPSCVP